MIPIYIYRLSRLLWKWKVPVLPRLLKGINYLLFNCVLPPECSIGKGSKLWHSALGIILHPDVVIGENCHIYNFVVIGGAHAGPKGPSIRIVIGDNCVISAGAKILCKKGTLAIGNNATIAANAVVLSDVRSSAVMGGIPAVELRSDKEQVK